MEKGKGGPFAGSNSPKRQALIDFIHNLNEDDFNHKKDALTGGADSIISDFSNNTKCTIQQWRERISQLLLEEKFVFDESKNITPFCIAIFDDLWFASDPKTYEYRKNRALQIEGYIDGIYAKAYLDNTVSDGIPFLFTTIHNDPSPVGGVAWDSVDKYESSTDKAESFDQLKEHIITSELLRALKEYDQKNNPGKYLEGRDAKPGFGKVLTLITANVGDGSEAIDLYMLTETAGYTQQYVLYDRNRSKIIDVCDYLETHDDGALDTYTFSWPTAGAIASLDKVIGDKKLDMVGKFFPSYLIAHSTDLSEHDLAGHKNFESILMHIVGLMVLQLYIDEVGSSTDDISFKPFILGGRNQTGFHTHKKIVDRYLKKIQLRKIYTDKTDINGGMNGDEEFGVKRNNRYYDIIKQTFEESLLACCKDICSAIDSIAKDNPLYEQIFVSYLHEFDIENPFASYLGHKKKEGLYSMFEQLFKKSRLYNCLETVKHFDATYTMKESLDYTDSNVDSLESKSLDEDVVISKNLHIKSTGPISPYIDPAGFTTLHREICELKESLINTIKKAFIEGDDSLLAKNLSTYFNTFSSVHNTTTPEQNVGDRVEITINNEVWHIYYEAFEEIMGIDPDSAEDLENNGLLESDDDFVDEEIYSIESFSICKLLSENNKKHPKLIQEREILYFPDILDLSKSNNSQVDLHFSSTKIDSYTDTMGRVCFKCYEYTPVSHTSLAPHFEEHYALLREKYCNEMTRSTDDAQLTIDTMHTITESLIKKTIQTYLSSLVYKGSYTSNTNTRQGDTDQFYTDSILGQALIDSLWNVDTMQHILKYKAPLAKHNEYKHSTEYVGDQVSSESFFDFYYIDSFLRYIVDNTATLIMKRLQHTLEMEYDNTLNEYHLYPSNARKAQSDNVLMFNVLESFLGEIINCLRAELSEKMITENLDIQIETLYLDDLLKNE